MYNFYDSSPYEQYRKSCERSISAISFPDNFWQSFLLGFSSYQCPLYTYRIGTGKKRLLITGGVHGRETINSFVLLSFIVHYIKHKNEYQDWFCSHTLYIIPMLNPDGYLRSLTDSLWKNNGRNVDLNRNFPCKSWKAKWENDTPASEVETKFLIHIFSLLKPDYYIDIHSRGQGIYYYRNAMPASYNQTQLFYAKKIQQLTGYTLYPPTMETDECDSGGNTVQYFAEKYQKPAFTIETVPDEVAFPIPDSYRETIFRELVELIFIF